mgnify:FL=1
MSKIVYLNHQEGGIETVSAALGDGRTLGLNPNQLDTIKKNVNDQVMSFNKPSIEPVTEPVMPTSEVTPSPIPVIEPAPEPASVPFVAPVVPEPTPVSEPVVVPIASPVTSEPTKVVTETTNNNVEIVSNNKKTDYDTLMEEIASLNQKYQTELNAILEKYQTKINAYETQINDLKGKAEEHLKNAQAAETIATIAHQNAQNVNPGIL